MGAPLKGNNLAFYEQILSFMGGQCIGHVGSKVKNFNAKL